MGLGGVLARRVFSKSRASSDGHRDSNEKSSAEHKNRWSSVRHYLCGDEFSAAHEEDEAASPKSSAATAAQPAAEASGDDEEESINQVIKSEEHEEASSKEENSSSSSTTTTTTTTTAKPTTQEDAAILIQSAFRGFTARRRLKEMRRSGEGEESAEGTEDPDSASVASSTEVQVGGSVDTLGLSEESIAMQQRAAHHKSRPQVFRAKEEWDDSTVSCNELKLRIQNRLEATNRRERALAYAFSQQLRTCNTKKRSTRSDQTEPNIGWSWLERWMATRLPEGSSAEDCLSKHFDTISIDKRSILIKKRFDVAIEERESCGSNDVSVNFDGGSINTPQTPRSGYRQVKNRLKATRIASRRKTGFNYRCATRSSKVSNKEHQRVVDKEKGGNNKQEQAKNQVDEDTACDAPCLLPPPPPPPSAD